MCLRGLFRGSGQNKASRPQSKSSTTAGVTSASASASTASSTGPFEGGLTSQPRQQSKFSLPDRSRPNGQVAQSLSNQELNLQPASSSFRHQDPPSTQPNISSNNTDNMRKSRASKVAKKTANDSPGTAASKLSRLTMGKGKRGGYFNAGGTAAAPSAASGAKLDKEFDALRNPNEDSNNLLGVNSTMEYLGSLGVSPENAEVFVAMELLQAPNFGEITRKGFVDGWTEAGLGASKTAQTQHLKSRVQQLSTDPVYFKRVFRYAFVAGKEGDQKALALDNAIEFWKVLFTSPGRPWKTKNHDWLALWTDFLADKWTRSVNRDMWNMTLEFATKSMSDETLSFYDPDGAWPSVIDDFVTWCKDKGIGGTSKAAAAMDVD